MISFARVRAALCAVTLTGAAFLPAAGAQAAPASAEEARAIAKEAYIFGYSLVDHYRIQHAYFVDRSHPEYKGTWNQVYNNARVYTPQDKAIQSPNSDTPYSTLGADLRTEPLIVTMPKIDKDRYYAAQFIDLYTHNFSYVGSRTTGNGGGKYLLAGPRWKGKIPKGIDAVIRSETELAFVFYRTQLFRSDDIENVKKVQAGYQVQPLSAYLGTPAPAKAPEIAFIKPLTREEERSSLDFFKVLNFVLGFCPTHPSERALMARLAKLDIGAGKSFDPEKLSPEIRKAIEDGMADSWMAIDDLGKKVAAGIVTSGDMLGSREQLKNNYLYRMRATLTGIYGNSREEAIYPAYYIDASGQKLDGAGNRYVLRFAPGALPPVNAFWSLTLYDARTRMLVDNPINRYLINSPMLPELKRDADGGITLYIQRDNPGKDKESNWLPAPDGQFVMALRLFWPKQEALNRSWKAPLITRLPNEAVPVSGN